MCWSKCINLIKKLFRKNNPNKQSIEFFKSSDQLISYLNNKKCDTVTHNYGRRRLVFFQKKNMGELWLVTHTPIAIGSVLRYLENSDDINTLVFCQQCFNISSPYPGWDVMSLERPILDSFYQLTTNINNTIKKGNIVIVATYHH